MPQKRSFISNNWQGIIIVIMTTIFYVGATWNSLESKIDQVQATTIAQEVVGYRAYPKTDGKVLEMKFEQIAKDLTEIKVMLEKSLKNNMTSLNAVY